ncbi:MULTISPECIES: LLM class F420-dependent oxidoreductase [Streptomyces]|uniref:Rif11 homolog n=2 Tax=Streptomyces avermitilis TaxID=33903 RepID=Q826U2_STRAW|nr:MULTISPECIES: LLM class F420-dependent oxidoreductase [Streptomyces]KUN53141.1 5,10-methylene tetrahydromethanopterin reductase [Streptomyces avermitilis]MYT02624.1 TIGR03621 family F420-dependent LLM class oxidoreductase [Streptomyces sp. SID5469]OOV11676.1 LLM class F420-dependent oxidoreductase [Streptomyces avermitilis]BAC74794.1 putative Rif11 homolog [Streptomyces avermitilis MA-4680 = NBRC 14893]BBJ55398.1 LLM class F420-dependent oxidoreductase [Streptomyces avermitilis]
MARPFRFGVNLLDPAPAEEWRAKCRRAEELGYDVILVPDHLGMPAPFPALVAAAEATERVRLGTFVLNAGFWNPALLAREVATTDALTGGRLELGLGTGYVQAEHDTAGLPYGSPRERVDHLVRTVEELERLLGSPEHRPGIVQKPRVPLLIGGNGDRMLRLTAEHADIAAFAGAHLVPGSTTGKLAPVTAGELDERVARYRRLAADRAEPAELNLLVQMVAVTEDRAAAVQGLRERVPQLTEEQVLELPIVLVGTPAQITAQVLAQRERYGFSYLTVLEPYMEAFAPVIEALRGA